MVRVADAVARERGAPFLATGESLGQVSSQTLPHLAAIDGAATRPILRPLLGWDKEEIIRVAQRIGTFETSKGPEVCDVLGPKHPATHAPIEDVLREESKLDVPSMVEKAIATLGRRAVPPPGAARTAVPSATMKR
jgi:thiamine biosynthesis protein ThiI